MQHITLTTGDIRWSPRTEVDDGLMGLLVDHLGLARTGRAPVPGHAAYATSITTAGNVLMATIWRGELPILTMAVVPADGDLFRVAALLGARTIPAEARTGPWCLVQFHATAALVPADDLGWMGDYERCLAWAWLDTPTTGVQ